MKHTDIRKKDIAALSPTALVDLLWEITKSVDETAAMFDDGCGEARDSCVISPGQILDIVEEKALPDRFAWARKSRKATTA